MAPDPTRWRFELVLRPLPATFLIRPVPPLFLMMNVWLSGPKPLDRAERFRDEHSYVPRQPVRLFR